MADATPQDAEVQEVQEEQEHIDRTVQRPRDAMMEEIVATRETEVLEDIEVQMSVEVGRTELTIKELLRLNEGSVVELDRMAGDHLDIFVNGTIIAKGEVVMVGERFGIRFLEIVDPEKRAQTL